MPAPPALLCYDGSPGARRAIDVGGGLLGGGPAVVLTSSRDGSEPRKAGMC